MQPLVTLAFPLLIGLVACSSDARSARRPSSEAFAKELGIDTTALKRTASGLRYEDVEVGRGVEATPGRTVLVHYTGWLASGEKFDSSRDRGEPFSFPLGQGQVIPGWEEGVAGMRVRGRRKLVIPPALGYGDAGAPPAIPPGATLVFDVELLDVR